MGAVREHHVDPLTDIGPRVVRLVRPEETAGHPFVVRPAEVFGLHLARKLDPPTAVPPADVDPGVLVAAAVQAFSDNPALKVEPHPMGTLLSGDWDDVLGAVKMATVQLHAEGVARVTSVLKVGTRTDRAG